MTDIPRDPSDRRDDRIAALLETEPLDEVTRARLVQNAMAAAAEPTTTAQSSRWAVRTRWLSVAAALVVVLAVGLAVILRNDSGSQPTAARAPQANQSDAAEAKGAAEASGLDRTFSTGSGIQPLGDLGDVGSNATLRRAVTAARVAAPASASTDLRAQAATPSADAAPCVIKPRGTIVAAGSGTARGAAVAVYVVERPDGSRVAVTVGPGCDLGEPVPL